MPNNLGLDPFSDPVGHFEAPFLVEGMVESKKLIKQKLIRGSNNLRFDLFPDPIGHFGYSRREGVAGGEQVPLAPLG